MGCFRYPGLFFGRTPGCLFMGLVSEFSPIVQTHHTHSERKAMETDPEFSRCTAKAYEDERKTSARELLVATPSKKSGASDRFITAAGGSEIISKLNYLSSEKKTTRMKRKHSSSPETEVTKRDESIHQIYKNVLVNEMLPSASVLKSPLERRNPNSILRYSDVSPISLKMTQKLQFQQYYTSTLSLSSQKALQTPKKLVRNISKTPYKVLDAPELHDDFYLNLVDWSSTNFLGVGLGSCVYLWSANTSKVVKLCDLSPDDTVTSVSWIQRGTHIAVGTNQGLVQLWDVERMKKVRQFSGHIARVGVLAWNQNTVTSGSRDRKIFHRDVREANDYTTKLLGHKQEVCGLKWSSEGMQMASGGNDNKLLIWDARNTKPTAKFKEHKAAVKAIAWSPHTHGLLASGGGSADKCIKFWNTNNNQILSSIDTGSQVCNLAWSKNSSELVSTHGYSQNQICIWKYPTMTQTATLTGHTFRVLYLAMSPDGQNIVSGAGDETLRFWTVFNKARYRDNDAGENALTIR